MLRLTFPRVRPRRRSIVPIVLLAGLLTSPVAHASKAYVATDARGDAKTGTAGHDILAVSSTYDDVTGSFSATVETADDFVASKAGLSVAFGTAVNGSCARFGTDDPRPGVWVELFAEGRDGPPLFVSWGILGVTPVIEDGSDGGVAGFGATGNTFTMSAPANPVLAGYAFDCVFAQTYVFRQDPSQRVADEAQGFLVVPVPDPPKVLEPPKAPADPAPPKFQAPAPVPAVDTDRDGLTDAVDVCPGVPGAAANGCPTTAVGREFRLGAKRVVVDALVARTGKICPPRGRVSISVRNRRIGTGVVPIEAHGAYCRFQGVVRRTGRAKKVRVVASATGLPSTTRVVKQ